MTATQQRLPLGCADGQQAGQPMAGARVRSQDTGWRIDEHTRSVGRRGLAAARAALAAAAGRAEARDARRRAA